MGGDEKYCSLGPFNLGYAIAKLEELEPGVYVAINGKAKQGLLQYSTNSFFNIESVQVRSYRRSTSRLPYFWVDLMDSCVGLDDMIS